MLKLDDQTLLHLRVKGIANDLYLCSGRNVLWCAGDGGRGVCSSDVHCLAQKPVSAAEMQFTHATRSPRASQIAGRVVCGSKVDIAEGVSARDSVAWEKSFLQLVFEVLVRCNSKPSSTHRLPPTALVVHSCERTTAIGNRKVCCSCFFRWSMVMACSSVHRRDDTLDLVQCPKTRQDYTCIYHYRLYNTRNLSAGTYGHQLYKHTRYVAISVKSKHVLKIKRVNTRQCNCT